MMQWMLHELQAFTGMPKLVIFGGNGFVGSRVCEEALKTGLSVVSINRSGPPKLSASWVHNVDWVKVTSYSPSLKGLLKSLRHLLS